MMAKTQDQQAKAYLERIPELLEQNEHSSIDQYRDDFFAVFRDAYHSGFCTGEQQPKIFGEFIWDYAAEHDWVHSEMKETDKRYADIETVKTWWDEWTYALEHYRPS
jgi:hypothetical protein